MTIKQTVAANGDMTERIQFTCIRCGKEVDREPHMADIEGITPVRCDECVLEMIAEDSESR